MVAKLKQLQADAETIVAFLSNEAAVQQLKQDKAYNLRFLQDVRHLYPSALPWHQTLAPVFRTHMVVSQHRHMIVGSDHSAASILLCGRV